MGTPSSLFLASLKTYIDYIPIQNYWMIPGIADKMPFYGLPAFTVMLDYMLKTDRFDYVVYIDEDCFITNMDGLIDELKSFINSDCCIAGPQDGGVICHRTHSKYLINTFLSFWNIKLLRKKEITMSMINDMVKSIYYQHPNETFKFFKDELQNRKELKDKFETSASVSIDRTILYRNNNCSSECPYCSIVRDNPLNPVERYQIPYSFDDDKAEKAFEPYYILEEALVLLTNTPIYYLFATDLYNDEYVKNNVKFDISGLSSAILKPGPINSKMNLIAVHTWNSRFYTKWPSTQQELENTKRINTIIKNFTSI